MDRKLIDRMIAEEEFLPAEQDFKSYIARMKSEKAEAVVVLLFPGALASFAKQARDSKLGADLAGIELFEDEHEVKASEGALVGHWYVNADVATPAFDQLYRSVYHEQPGWAVANAYDALNLLAEAAMLHGKNNPAVAEYLATLKNYTGAAGTYSASGDNRFGLPATIKIVRQDGFEKLHN